MSSIRHFLTPASAITSAGLAAGFLALLAIVDAQILRATIWVILAAVLDSLDGAVARRRSGDQTFGTNLDSLADMVSFGVVPAMALYLGPLHAVPIFGLATSVVFLLGAAWRLARFQIVKRYDCFLGMPMPVAGVMLMVFLLWRPAPEVALIITGAVSALLVSTLPFPTLQTIYRATRNTHRGHPRGRLPGR